MHKDHLKYGMTTMSSRNAKTFQVVVSENWIVYTYWNTKNHRQEIASLDLYENEWDYNVYAICACISKLTIATQQR